MFRNGIRIVPHTHNPKENIMSSYIKVSYEPLPDGRRLKRTTHFEDREILRGGEVVEVRKYPYRNHITTEGKPDIPTSGHDVINPNCKTPGAIFITEVKSATEMKCATISMEVRLPGYVRLSEADAIEIEEKAHDLFEKILAKKFK